MTDKPRCARCGRVLRDPVSIAAGMGPVCRGAGNSGGKSSKRPGFKVSHGAASGSVSSSSQQELGMGEIETEQPFKLVFTLSGQPVPKQSFRVSGRGGFTAQRVKAWQNRVGWAAKEAMQGRAPYAGPVQVILRFHLKDYRRVDLDNLSKAILDGMNEVVLEDDRQVVQLVLYKYEGQKMTGLEAMIKAV